MNQAPELSKDDMLLQADAATISEIAYRVGFNGASYFHKCFLEEYGYTPGRSTVLTRKSEISRIQELRNFLPQGAAFLVLLLRPSARVIL